MRLDKFLGNSAAVTRREAAKAIRAGRVTVNGTVVRQADFPLEPERDRVTFCGETVRYARFHYFLLNKPAGYVSATEDGRDPTVLSLLSSQDGAGLFPCGRLDKNTLGLMLLTDDGDLAHRLLSPRRHVKKVYAFRVKYPLDEAECARFRTGLTLEDGYETKPAEITLGEDGCSGTVTLVEGKYHQIKRMMLALHNQIVFLERISFGPLSLPTDLPRGAYRALTEQETAALYRAAGREESLEKQKKQGITAR